MLIAARIRANSPSVRSNSFVGSERRIPDDALLSAREFALQFDEPFLGDIESKFILHRPNRTDRSDVCSRRAQQRVQVSYQTLSVIQR